MTITPVRECATTARGRTNSPPKKLARRQLATVHGHSRTDLSILVKWFLMVHSLFGIIMLADGVCKMYI